MERKYTFIKVCKHYLSIEKWPIFSSKLCKSVTCQNHLNCPLQFIHYGPLFKHILLKAVPPKFYFISFSGNGTPFTVLYPKYFKVATTLCLEVCWKRKTNKMLLFSHNKKGQDINVTSVKIIQRKPLGKLAATPLKISNSPLK